MAEVQSFLLDDDAANIQQFVVDKSSMRVDDSGESSITL